ncbi:MAG: cupin domain-containing protein [Anaerolineae bacterium]|nr:cupin domain-containing protein [Phycisphaerae bacterium]
MTIARPLLGNLVGSKDSNFVAAEWTDGGSPAGSPPMWIAPLHVHYHDDEAWYVLKGTLIMRVGSEDVEAPAGSAVFVPRGTPHTYRNPNPTLVRYLLVMTPKIHRLIEAIHAMPDRNPSALQMLFAGYDSELLAM